MRFEWDEDKRRANIDKHGIDFIQARKIFDGRADYEYLSAFVEEERYVTVAHLDGQLIAVGVDPQRRRLHPHNIGNECERWREKKIS